MLSLFGGEEVNVPKSRKRKADGTDVSPKKRLAKDMAPNSQVKAEYDEGDERNDCI